MKHRECGRILGQAVDEKLKGGKPPKKAPETNTQEALEKQVYNAMMGIF